MCNRIHIVGCAPRSGTTLMTELMVNGFEIDGFTEHETSIFVPPPRPYEVFCSKKPNDVLAVRPLLALDRRLWVIYLLRDPRDVVVSRHRQNPGKYWANLRLWKEYHAAARRMTGHPRFVTVRYEDLVREPSAAQARLMREIPFLVRRADFADFHQRARPSEQTIEALGGVRPVDTSSIGTWRQHKPRLAGQLAMHGPITRELIELGYETDARWLEELDGIVPDTQPSRFPEHSTFRRRIDRTTERYVATLRYAFGLARRAFRVLVLGFFVARVYQPVKPLLFFAVRGLETRATKKRLPHSFLRS